MSKNTPIIGNPTTPEPSQKPGNANVERPGQSGPLSGTTGKGPTKPATPGKG
jgi:hypothetical protein